MRPIAKQKWMIDNKLHRIGGVKYIAEDGTQIYHENNKRHRIGGPTAIYSGGDEEYWIDGKQVTELEHDLLYDIMKLKGLT